MIANERKKVMYVRKMRKKWQCLVRQKGISISQSFYMKSDASRWGKAKEIEIMNGTYLKDLKLVEMRLKKWVHGSGIRNILTNQNTNKY